MIVNNISDLYEKVSAKTGKSSTEVKRCIMEIFGIIKEQMSTYPKYPAMLLNRFCNIEIKTSSLKNMIKRRLMSDEQKIKWNDVLDKVTEYHSTKKLINKNKENDISEKDICDGQS